MCTCSGSQQRLFTAHVTCSPLFPIPNSLWQETSRHRTRRPRHCPHYFHHWHSILRLDRSSAASSSSVKRCLTQLCTSISFALSLPKACACAPSCRLCSCLSERTLFCFNFSCRLALPFPGSLCIVWYPLPRLLPAAPPQLHKLQLQLQKMLHPQTCDAAPPFVQPSSIQIFPSSNWCLFPSYGTWLCVAGTVVSVALLGVLLTAMSAAVLRAASYFVEA